MYGGFLGVGEQREVGNFLWRRTLIFAKGGGLDRPRVMAGYCVCHDGDTSSKEGVLFICGRGLSLSR